MTTFIKNKDINMGLINDLYVAYIYRNNNKLICKPKKGRKPRLTLKLLKERFKYVDGDLVCILGHRSSRHQIGDIAGYVTPAYPTRYININYTKYKYAHVIVMFHRGKLPKSVEYIDGNKLNTRIENLKPKY